MQKNSKDIDTKLKEKTEKLNKKQLIKDKEEKDK
jgi:hypothetical protein